MFPVRSVNISKAMGFVETPTSDWSCAKWMDWHKGLVKTYSANYSASDALRFANQIFLTWWDKLKTLFDKKDFCGYGSDFFNYFSSVGLSDQVLSIAQALVNPVVKTTVSVVTSTGKVIETVAEGAESVAKAASNTAGALKWVLPTVLVVGVGGVAWWGYNNYIAPSKPKRSLSGVRRKRKK